MTVEDVLKRRFSAILLEETPYVLEEARFGMFDIAAYMPEESVFAGLGESKKLSAVQDVQPLSAGRHMLGEEERLSKEFRAGTRRAMPAAGLSG